MSEDPCRLCGFPVEAPSVSGPDICPACDMGVCRFDRSHRVDGPGGARVHYAREHGEPMMSRAEALEELRRRYRLRFVVEVEHEGRSYGARGATMATAPREVEGAAVDLLRLMIERGLE